MSWKWWVATDVVAKSTGAARGKEHSTVAAGNILKALKDKGWELFTSSNYCAWYGETLGYWYC